MRVHVLTALSMHSDLYSEEFSSKRKSISCGTFTSSCFKKRKTLSCSSLGFLQKKLFIVHQMNSGWETGNFATLYWSITKSLTWFIICRDLARGVLRHHKDALFQFVEF